MNTKYSFDDGKYEVLRDDNTYKTTLYRNGEYWEAGTADVLGDKMFHAMLNETDRLREVEAMYNGLCDDDNPTNWSE